MPLDEAIIDAGAVRFRPMLLTGAAVVVGSFVIVFDPIFQGLALAMMFGEIASTTLSRITIPVLYYMVQSRKRTSGFVKKSICGVTLRRGYLLDVAGRLRAPLLAPGIWSLLLCRCKSNQTFQKKG